MKDDEFNPAVNILQLSGITSVTNGYLGFGIVSTIGCSTATGSLNMPDAELRRQRVAYRRGLVRAASVGAVILLVMSGLHSVLTAKKNR